MNVDGKYILLRRKTKIFSLLFQGNRLCYAGAEEAAGDLMGNIYVGKVKNIVPNIQAAFVETTPGMLCFLSLAELKKKTVAGDEIIVQVSKEAVKSKQPVVTTQLSLSGKYCVVTLGRPGISYSSKLSAKSKARIGEALRLFLECNENGLESSDLGNKEFGVVIRTNAQELEDISALTREIEFMKGQMRQICTEASQRTCYSLIYQRLPQYLTKLRDFPRGAVAEIVTDEPELFEVITSCALKHPYFGFPPVRLYEDSLLPLHKLYSVDTRLKEAMASKVWLKSGGYLVIEPTEALTVIDVNTGKVTGKKTTEETFFQMNLEAAAEIAQQLSLRNISGIIIIDFINMKETTHKEKLLDTMRSLMRKDMVKSSMPQMTSLGLVELTRMKTNRPLAEQLEHFFDRMEE